MALIWEHVVYWKNGKVTNSWWRTQAEARKKNREYVNNNRVKYTDIIRRNI
jgi:hypothetical protein